MLGRFRAVEIQASRDEFLIAIDKPVLEHRLRLYFDPGVTDTEIRTQYPTIMAPSGRFDPIKIRTELGRRGPLWSNIVRYTYRPFDVRWLYWEPETKLLDEKRAEYWPHISNNLFLECRKRLPADEFNRGTIVRGLADNFGNGLSHFFPLYLHEHRRGNTEALRPNLPQSVVQLLTARKLKPEVIFRHIAAILHSPSYRTENAGALRLDCRACLSQVTFLTFCVGRCWSNLGGIAKSGNPSPWRQLRDAAPRPPNLGVAP
jgi:hypothetical protein